MNKVKELGLPSLDHRTENSKRISQSLANGCNEPLIDTPTEKQIEALQDSLQRNLKNIIKHQDTDNGLELGLLSLDWENLD